MKKVAVVCIYFVLLLSYSFASDDVFDASISSKQVEMGESLRLEITIDEDEINQENTQIHILGIENFEIFSQSQGYNFESINGQTQSQRNYVLDLRPLSAGKFTLGPIKLMSGTGEISNTEVFDIEVVESQLSQIMTGEDVVQEKSDDVIKPDRTASFPLIGFMGILGIFLSLFYIFLKYIFSPHKNNDSQKETVQNGEDFNEKMKEYFEKLAQQNNKLESQRFFRVYNTGLRKIFIHAGMQDAETATLKEIKRYFKEEQNVFLEIFKKSYEHEYSGKDKTPTTRKKYIERVLENL